MTLRRIAWIFAAVIGLIVLAAGGATVLVARGDAGPVVARLATAALGRKVTMGALQMGYADGRLKIVADDVHLANPDWAHSKDMVRLGHLVAEIDPLSVRHGPLLVYHASIDGLDIDLERGGPEKAANWHFSPDHAPPPPLVAGAPVPSRAMLPTILNLSLHGLAYREYTSSGALITIDATEIQLTAPSAAAPALLSVVGSYGKLPIKGKINLQAFDVLRQPTIPYGINLSLVTAGGTGNADLTAMDPMNFDGVDGRISLNFTDLATTLADLGAPLPVAVPATVGGTLHHLGQLWQVPDANLMVSKTSLTGPITLIEGARGQPDTLNTALTLGPLDLDHLLDVLEGPQPAQPPAPHRMSIDPVPGMLLDARLHVPELMFRHVRFTDVTTRAQVQAGELGITELAMDVLGGHVEGALTGKPAPNGLAFHAELEAVRLEPDRLPLLASLPAGLFTAPVALRGHIDGSGGSSTELFASTTGAASLSMGLLGGQMHGGFEAISVGAGVKLTADLNAVGIAPRQVAKLAGLPQDLLDGPVSFSAALNATGTSEAEVLAGFTARADLSTSVLGGHLTNELVITPAASGYHLHAIVNARRLDPEKLTAFADLPQGLLTDPVTLRADLTSSGHDRDQIKANARGTARLTAQVLGGDVNGDVVANPTAQGLHLTANLNADKVDPKRLTRLTGLPAGLLSQPVALRAKLESTGRGTREFLARGDVKVAVNTNMLGGRMVADLSGRAAGNGMRMQADLSGVGLEAARIASVLNVPPTLLAGPLTVRANIEGTGRSGDDMIRSGSGQLVLAMAGGEISRLVMAAAAQDLGGLLRGKHELVPLTCMLSVVSLRSGVADITPLRIRASTGWVFGGGSVNLLRQTLDMTLKTDGKTTGFLALDLPVRITGPFKDVSVRPLLNSNARALDARGAVVEAGLPASLRTLALANPCR